MKTKIWRIKFRGPELWGVERWTDVVATNARVAIEKAIRKKRTEQVRHCNLHNITEAVQLASADS